MRAAQFFSVVYGIIFVACLLAATRAENSVQTAVTNLTDNLKRSVYRAKATLASSPEGIKASKTGETIKQSFNRGRYNIKYDLDRIKQRVQRTFTPRPHRDTRNTLYAYRMKLYAWLRKQGVNVRNLITNNYTTNNRNLRWLGDKAFNGFNYAAKKIA